MPEGAGKGRSQHCCLHCWAVIRHLLAEISRCLTEKPDTTRRPSFLFVNSVQIRLKMSHFLCLINCLFFQMTDFKTISQLLRIFLVQTFFHILIVHVRAALTYFLAKTRVVKWRLVAGGRVSRCVEGTHRLWGLGVEIKS